MIAILEARRQVRLFAADWAAEAIDTYGEEAGRVLRHAQRRYGLVERYAFRQVRKAIRNRSNRPRPALAIIARAVLGFLKDVALKGPTIGAR